MFQITLDPQPNLNDLARLRAHASAANDERRELGIFLRDAVGALMGGVYGWLSNGWLGVDTLWLAEELRGQDYGTRLLTAIEQAALAQGVTRSFLSTTSFQARPFYEKRGYRVFFAHPNFINGHTIYFLSKDQLHPEPADPALRVEDPPTTEDIDALNRSLTTINAPYVGKPVFGELAVWVREGNSLVGGLYGWRYAHTFSADLVWLDEALRQSGAAEQAVQRLVSELSASGAPDVNTRVAGPTALPIFETAGFQIVGTHVDFPLGSATYYLQKWL